MDPVTAIQCVSAIISFVDFGLKLVSKSHQIYSSVDGVLQDHAEQDAVARRLGDLADNLANAIESSAKTRKLSAAEIALQKITVECNASAADFTAAIDEIRATGTHKRWDSFRQALKAVWKKEDLEQHRGKLESYRLEAVTYLLVIIQYVLDLK